MEVNVEPNLSILVDQEVVCLDFSPFDWCQELLAVALPNIINIYSIKVKDDGGLEEQLLCSNDVEAECTALAWTNNTDPNSKPARLQLLIATTDHVILLLNTDLKSTSLTEICRHTAAINSLTCSRDGLCASIGDDQLLQVWETKEEQTCHETVMLTQPGQTVKFHPDIPGTLLVLEVSGTLRMYQIGLGEESNTFTLTADWSARCPAPSLDADWSDPDSNLIVATGPSGVSILNLEANRSARRSHRVIGSGSDMGALTARCARHSRHLVAALSPLNTLHVVHTTQSRVPLTAHLPAASGLSWHRSEPIIAVGSDRKVVIWKLARM